MKRKVYPKSNIHYNFTFSYKYLIAVECPQKETMDTDWFKYDVLDEVTNNLCNGNFGTEILGTTYWHHDRCFLRNSREFNEWAENNLPFEILYNPASSPDCNSSAENIVSHFKQLISDS